MLTVLIVVLFLLWILGYVRVDGLTLPDIVLFNINGQDITLWNVLALFVVGWIIGILPSPFRQIASVLLILWVLSAIGVIAIAGLPSILLITIIVGLVLYLFVG